MVAQDVLQEEVSELLSEQKDGEFFPQKNQGKITILFLRFGFVTAPFFCKKPDLALDLNILR